MKRITILSIIILSTIYFSSCFELQSIVDSIFETNIDKPIEIKSESMLPTFKIGDKIKVDRHYYENHIPQRGDIVVYIPPDNKEMLYIHRIIGLPGEMFMIKDGFLYINGQKIIENYIKESMMIEFPETKIPDREYFIIGDNRNYSMGSNIFGFVPLENIKGKVFLLRESK